MVYFDFQPEERFPSTWKPVVDVCERPGEFLIRIEVPGVAKNEIRLNWKAGVLTITGSKRRELSGGDQAHYLCLERQHGRFRRDIAIQAPIDFAKASARLKDGVLEVRLPKRNEGREDRVIPVE